jgi:probable HAF family extracellular repeat protein
VTSLGTLPSPYNYQSGASGINDAGQIIGESGRNFDGGSQSHAFLYDDGSMIDLGTLGGLSSYAEGINSVGQVVGYSNYSSGGTGAFLYENGKMMDLNGLISPGSGWTLQGATGINDSGWIIGVGNYGGFLLIPTPEPTALATLTIGAGLALAHRRNLTMPIARIRVTPTHCKHSGMLSLKNHAMTAPAFD